MRLLRFSLVLLFMAMMLSTLLLAQSTTATISGVVTDPSGAVVQGAQVTAVNKGTNAARTATTNSSGTYSITNLTPGAYMVSISKSGFGTAKVDNVTLTVAEPQTINAKFAVGTAQETVEVSGQGIATIETENAQLSTLIDKRTAVDLPLLTRNTYDLVLLSPGTFQTNNGNNGFSVNGARDRNNNFLLDGVDNNDTSVPGIPNGITASNPDSIQEFRVITNNFAPEFGRNTGAVIDVITTSGTNAFHGDVYEFGRYTALGARDFFNQAPAKQNPYVRNDFGGSIGGPIIKDRTFFFINGEYQRFRTTLTNATLVPTAAFKSGVITVPADPISGTPAQTVDLTSINPTNLSGLTVDPTVSKILNLLPPPNAGAAIPGLTGNLNFASPDNLNSYNWVGKIDHKLTQNNQLSLRYAYNHSLDSNPFHSEFAPGLDAVSVPAYSHGVFAGLTSTISPTMVNDFKFGLNRNFAGFISNCGQLNSITGTDAFGNGRDITAPDSALGVGPLSVLGCNTLFDSASQSRHTGTTSFSDDISWVKGKHTLKYGGEYRNVHSNGPSNFNSRDTLSFNRFFNTGTPAGNLAPDCNTTGNVAPCTQNLQTIQDLMWFLVGGEFNQFQAQFFNKAGARVPTDNKFFRQHEVDGFIQDSWKVLSNLTVTYGLRYEWNGVPFEEGGNFSQLFANPDSAGPFTFTLLGRGGSGPQIYKDSYKNFEPRFGFAWDPFKDGKTSVRGGGGIFTDRIFDNIFGNSRGNPPFQNFISNNFTGGPQTPETTPFAFSTPPPLTFSNGSFQGVTLIDPNLKMPQSYNWNFGIQHEFFGNTVAEVNYVGSHGLHQLRVLDAVPPDPVLVQQQIANCVANGACKPGDPAGLVSGGALYAGNGNAGFFPATRNTAIEPGFFGGANITRSNADSHFNSLQVKVTRRMTHGVQVSGAYTWAHATDDGFDPLTPELGSGSFPVDSRNPNFFTRGNSDEDIRHRGVVDFIYDLPFGSGRSYLSHGFVGKLVEGIQMSSIISAQTGHPFNIFTPNDTERTGINNSYANLVGQPFANLGSRITASGVQTGPNIAAFAAAPFGFQGNVGRNHFYGPHYTNVDLKLSKIISLTERFKLEIRAEAFNILNHPELKNPAGNLNSPAIFGLSTQTITREDATTSARQIQVAGKITF